MKNKKTAKIVVLAGQSNAVGVGHTKCLRGHFSGEKIAEYRKGYEKIKINYYSHDKKSQGFVTTTVNCTEKSKDTVGPELGMAEFFSEKYPDEEIFIVKCAFGGTTLFGDWLSTSSGAKYSYEETKDCSVDGEKKTGWCYNELVKILGDSIDHLTEQGKKPKIYGFCWMQGESDSFAPETVEGYPARYENLLSDIKSRFEKYFDGCIYVDAGISEQWPYAKQMNEFKRKYAKDREDHRFIDTVGAGLTTEYEPIEEPDVAHYDSDSVIKLGKMFAAEIEL